MRNYYLMTNNLAIEVIESVLTLTGRMERSTTGADLRTGRDLTCFHWGCFLVAGEAPVALCGLGQYVSRIPLYHILYSIPCWSLIKRTCGNHLLSSLRHLHPSWTQSTFTIYRPYQEIWSTLCTSTYHHPKTSQSSPQLTDSPLLGIELPILPHSIDIISKLFHQRFQIFDFSRRHMARASTRNRDRQCCRASSSCTNLFKLCSNVS